jgi:hypothetical protein
VMVENCFASQDSALLTFEYLVCSKNGPRRG